MNLKSIAKVINAAVALIGGAQSAFAQQHNIEKNVVVTLGVSTENANETSEAANSLEQILHNSGNNNFALDFDPNGLVAKILVKNEDNKSGKNLDLLIKKLNSQMKKKVVIIEVEPAKITNGTQDDI